jgi:D-alanyl-D-alanine carboxypeptidase
MKSLKLLILLAVLSFSIAYSQNINKSKLDSLFNILAEKNKAMGSFAISKGEKVLYSRAIGYRSISDKENITSNNDTKYRIGSISKMFTATMIFQLIEEGKITLATTLDKYFPVIPNSKLITISDLLYHRSGIHNITDDRDYTSWMTLTKTQNEMVAIIADHNPDFKPGKKAMYSNSNYILLGYIIEKISGQNYSQNLEKRITFRLGLRNTYYGNKADIRKNECFSYQYNGAWKQMPETDMSIPGGAGALVSTPTDLTKFIEALFGLKMVSKNSLEQMKTIKDRIGMGMFPIPFYDQKGFGHKGGIDGFASNVIYFPDDSLALAYCTNGVVFPMNDILIGVLSIYYNRDYKIPTFVK